MKVSTKVSGRTTSANGEWKNSQLVENSNGIFAVAPTMAEVYKRARLAPPETAPYVNCFGTRLQVHDVDGIRKGGPADIHPVPDKKVPFDNNLPYVAVDGFSYAGNRGECRTMLFETGANDVVVPEVFQQNSAPVWSGKKER